MTLSDNPQTTQISAFFVAFHVFTMGQRRDFKFVAQRRDNLIIASPSPPTTNCPWKGCGYDHVTHLNSQSPL